MRGGSGWKGDKTSLNQLIIDIQGRQLRRFIEWPEWVSR